MVERKAEVFRNATFDTLDVRRRQMSSMGVRITRCCQRVVKISSIFTTSLVLQQTHIRNYYVPRLLLNFFTATQPV